MKLFRRAKTAPAPAQPPEKPRFKYVGRHSNGTDYIWRSANDAAREAARVHNGGYYLDGGIILPATKFWTAAK